MKENMPKTLKVLFIGNSYSENTAALMPNMAKVFEFKKVDICYLYKGGCSLEEHWNNLWDDSPEYLYCQVKKGFKTLNKIKILKKNATILDAVTDKKWDWIILQQTSRTSGKIISYDKLPDLVKLIKALLIDEKHTKFAFNMTWAYHTEYDKLQEYYDGSQEKMYEQTCEAAQYVAASNAGIDLIIPTGTAIQNIRTHLPREHEYTCDKTHLNANGAYVASMTAILALWTYYNSLVLLHFLVKDPYPAKPKYVYTQHGKKFKLNNMHTISYRNAAIASILDSYKVTEV